MKIKEIIIRHNLINSIGSIQLKHLVELYGYGAIDDAIKVVYRFNTLVRKMNIIKRDMYETRFYKTYYSTDVVNLENGKEI